MNCHPLYYTIEIPCIPEKELYSSKKALLRAMKLNLDIGVTQIIRCIRCTCNDEWPDDFKPLPCEIHV